MPAVKELGKPGYALTRQLSKIDKVLHAGSLRYRRVYILCYVLFKA